MRSGRKRPGFALLEVIIALAILSTAAISAILLTRQSSETVEQAREADRTAREAGNFMEKVSLWPREDLDRHIGERRQGRWILYVDRPSQVLYRIALYDSTRGKPILETALFRPESPPTPIDVQP